MQSKVVDKVDSGPAALSVFKPGLYVSRNFDYIVLASHHEPIEPPMKKVGQSKTKKGLKVTKMAPDKTTYVSYVAVNAGDADLEYPIGYMSRTIPQQAFLSRYLYLSDNKTVHLSNEESCQEGAYEEQEED